MPLSAAHRNGSRHTHDELGIAFLPHGIFTMSRSSSVYFTRTSRIGEDQSGVCQTFCNRAKVAGKSEVRCGSKTGKLRASKCFPVAPESGTSELRANEYTPLAKPRRVTRRHQLYSPGRYCGAVGAAFGAPEVRPWAQLSAPPQADAALLLRSSASQSWRTRIARSRLLSAAYGVL
jgi:hypothetical protein